MMAPMPEPMEMKTVGRGPASFRGSRWTMGDATLRLLNARGGSKEFDALLAYLRQNNGFDFTGYRRPSLARRITSRMDLLGLEDFQTYVACLKAHPEEFTALVNT